MHLASNVPASVAFAGLSLLATALAALRFVSWIAVGFTVRSSMPTVSPALRVGISCLVGAALTAFIYAIFAAAGAIPLALAADACLAVSGLALNGGPAARAIAAGARTLLPRTRAGVFVCATAALLIWIIAIGPPRDADVLHYHLAHVKQIVADGVWRQLPLCPYGVPFGTALTYLPFVWLGVPQVAHLLNAGIWVTTCALCVESAADADASWSDQTRRAALALALGATLMPGILKAATTAMADAPMMLAVAVSVVLLARVRSQGRSEAGLLAFAAFAGLQSRYQAGAVAIAVTLCGMVLLVRGRIGKTEVRQFCIGALAAGILASPFYIANALTLGAPTWPITLPFAPVAPGPVAALASRCTGAELSTFTSTRTGALRGLILDPTVFPIPLFLAIGVVAAAFRGRPSDRTIAAYAVTFMATWAAVQPGLLPRYALYLFPPAFFLIVPVACRLAASRWAPLVRVAGGVGTALFALLAGVYARDYVALALDGNMARFHSATWFWPALEWANHETPPTARFLVILAGGQTYYLNRWNRSADPENSAVIDWSRVRGACELDRVLLRGNIGYVLYSEGGWARFPNGRNVTSAVEAAKSAGMLTPVRSFDVRLSRLRMIGSYTRSRATVFAVDTSARRYALTCPQGGP